VRRGSADHRAIRHRRANYSPDHHAPPRGTARQMIDESHFAEYVPHADTLQNDPVFWIVTFPSITANKQSPASPSVNTVSAARKLRTSGSRRSNSNTAISEEFDSTSKKREEPSHVGGENAGSRRDAAFRRFQ
jgi:hypothetical protein